MPTASSSTRSIKTESSTTVFKKIVESIMMEAAEKCEEIDVQCEEEYQALRRKEISEQGEHIEKADKKRRENVCRDDRVSYTKNINLSRLAQLRAKTDIQNGILAEVKRRISKDNSSKYQKLMEKLLTQALLKLMEPEVHVTCRREDQHMVSASFQPSAHAYEKNTRLHVSVGFSEKTLPDKNCSGGMIVSNRKENISVNCLIDARVEQVCFLAMPMIVKMMFRGVQINRESPKLSPLKSITPEGPACRLYGNRPSSPSPPGSQLLEERLGIGTSSINIHAASEKHLPSKSDQHQASAGSKEPGVGSKELGVRSKEPGVGPKEPGVGSKETGSDRKPASKRASKETGSLKSTSKSISIQEPQDDSSESLDVDKQKNGSDKKKF